MTTHLEFNDIQGFIIRSFVKLPYAGYLFFTISDPILFKTWLANALQQGRITAANIRNPHEGICTTIAFSALGLHKLLGKGLLADSFPLEFMEGMVQEHRSRLLGDYAGNSPQQWRWGNGDGIEGIVILTADGIHEVENELDAFSNPAANGIQEITRVYAALPADGKEPFGFADGISQPIIKGTDREEQVHTHNSREYQLHAVAAGEFILGYPDGSQTLPRTPAISPALDPQGYLQPHHERPELRDFGRNGSFLVVRQLAQDVDAFNNYINQSPNPHECAEKMVGRKRNGEPLVQDPNSQHGHQNDFDYMQDPKGMGCPIGAHLRRTNPRSSVHASSLEDALEVTNRHRILRRGRVYQDKNNEVGLMFLCINASISRQFEFIQSTWSNDPFFQTLAGEKDPITGTRCPAFNAFTIPQAPYRTKLTQLPQWVQVKGGAYFFMPGLSSLAVIAQV